jgi:solute carrier family 25 uncoupling protein 27
MEANSIWNYIASGASAIVVSSLFNGLEVVRTRQINDGTAFALVPKGQYRSFLASLLRVVREEGVRGCWGAGLGAAWCREALYGSLKLGLYPAVRDVLGGHRAAQSSLLAKVASSALTGAVAQLLASPLDLAKMRLQAESGRVVGGVFTTGLREGTRPRISGVLDVLSQIYRKDGVGGLWRGWFANVARSALLVCGQLTGYDESKRRLVARGLMREGAALHLVAGVVSGLLSSALSAPAEVVRSRSMSLGQPFASCVAETWRLGGVGGFFTGFTAAAARNVPVLLVQYQIYERIRLLLGMGAFA